VCFATVSLVFGDQQDVVSVLYLKQVSRRKSKEGIYHARGGSDARGARASPTNRVAPEQYLPGFLDTRKISPLRTVRVAFREEAIRVMTNGDEYR